jgi:hypothetical protein
VQFGPARPDPVQPGTVSGVLFLHGLLALLSRQLLRSVYLTHTSAFHCARPSPGPPLTGHVALPCACPVAGECVRAGQGRDGLTLLPLGPLLVLLMATPERHGGCLAHVACQVVPRRSPGVR